MLKSNSKVKNSEMSFEKLKNQLKDTSWLFQESREKIREMPEKRLKKKDERASGKKLQSEDVNIEDLHYHMVEAQQNVRKMQK